MPVTLFSSLYCTAMKVKIETRSMIENVKKFFLVFTVVVLWYESVNFDRDTSIGKIVLNDFLSTTDFYFYDQFCPVSISTN